MIQRIEKALKTYWGYSKFRPMQEQAIRCAAAGKDSIVVMPTGGGKSLCFQAPAVTLEGTAIVISPLISLMKDQVDALTECGIPAVRIDSSLSFEQKRQITSQLRSGKVKLVYVSPERFVTERFINFLKKLKVSLVAIDEAHCVSMWGHDFRPEYRELGIIKETFKDVAVHAYTATATQQVRDDIAVQLKLDEPEMIVGSFDRSNLTYKIARRFDRMGQICEVLDRHKGESGIIYCLRRSDVEEVCLTLKARGYRAASYHAGLTNEMRKKHQELFINEDVDIIVATVAFGMGIDKSNVRYVIHAAMPKSLEHYQQESGRAGRDGLEAECCLFYSGADYGVWKSILSDSMGQAGDVAREKLSKMYEYCTNPCCRHKAILEYFGQQLDKDNCGGCDFCLGDVETFDRSVEAGREILECVVQLGEYFGADYTAKVLAGSRDQKIRQLKHNKLKSYGKLKKHGKNDIRDWIEELTGQNYLKKTGPFNVLNVSAKGWELLKDSGEPKLSKPVKRAGKKKVVQSVSYEQHWSGVDKSLFEILREVRKQIAREKKIPAFVVLSDASLREMARKRPSRAESFLEIKGIGQKKCRQYGEIMISEITDYCMKNSVAMDVAS